MPVPTTILALNAFTPFEMIPPSNILRIPFLPRPQLFRLSHQKESNGVHFDKKKAFDSAPNVEVPPGRACFALFSLHFDTRKGAEWWFYDRSATDLPTPGCHLGGANREIPSAFGLGMTPLGLGMTPLGTGLPGEGFRRRGRAGPGGDLRGGFLSAPDHGARSIPVP